MVDLTKYSVSLLYSRSKNLDYKKSIKESSTSLLVFLKEQGLITDDPLDEHGVLKLDFIVKESDLSPEGSSYSRKPYPLGCESLIGELIQRIPLSYWGRWMK
ncbi:hypothetical protein [Caldalkalibacillus mannanilyticus]|uniref:hypothetical protein n=1 Tax=Caldalkalibacillus mannanilyticus TaxID=1418 RepID=UPI001900E867|nr:hypothetical protein [Caldalkalibacillus mannanilyticus]